MFPSLSVELTSIRYQQSQSNSQLAAITAEIREIKIQTQAIRYNTADGTDAPINYGQLNAQNGPGDL